MAKEVKMSVCVVRRESRNLEEKKKEEKKEVTFAISTATKTQT